MRKGSTGRVDKEEKREQLARARMILRRARKFRSELARDLESRNFITDDIKAAMYTDIAAAALSCFPEDKVLQRLSFALEEDDLLNPLIAIPGPPTTATMRAMAHLDRLILRLDMIFGVWMPDDADEPTAPPDMARASPRDFRDTVHPNAEVRLGIRGGLEEAKLFLTLVQLVHRDLAAHSAM